MKEHLNETGIHQWRDSIYNHMLRTRGAKYRWFLRYLKMFRLVAKSPQRAEFLETYYTLMRYIDDIVDGDAPLPEKYNSSEQYLLDKIRFADNPINPADDADFLIRYCLQLGNEFGVSFHEETGEIFHSLLFDARRMGTNKIFSEQELMEHYHHLDIAGTVKATLKLFNEDAGKYLLLEPLGMASRFHYDIRDYKDDFEKGIINISAEDMDQLHISVEELSDENSAGVRRWKRAQAIRGLSLLQQHAKNLEGSGFHWSARWTFPLVYAWPAGNYFQKVIRQTKDAGVFRIPPMTCGRLVLQEATSLIS